MYTIYGIPNCNTVKKAIDWLKANNISFTFHDYKKQGITTEKLEQWSAQVGFVKLLNTRGTTWRGLDESTKESAATETGALQLMADKSSIIKRPVIEHDNTVVALGFDETAYQKAFAG